MTDLTHLNALKNTFVSEFNTNIPTVAIAFKAFVTSCDISDKFRISAIPDYRTYIKPFSTYADDLIYFSFDVINNKKLNKNRVRGISALVSSTDGFSITLPDDVCSDSQTLENIYFYILPDKRQPHSSLVKVGKVTPKSYVISSTSGECFECQSAGPEVNQAITIRTPKWFTAGFYDSTAYELSSLSGGGAHLYSDIPQTPEDIAAYRLGVFYAGKTLSRLSRRKPTAFNEKSSKLYLYTPITIDDGTPNASEVQFLTAILAGSRKNTAAFPLTGSPEESVSSALGSEYNLSLSVSSALQFPKDSYLIACNSDLPLMILGIVSKTISK